jgi:predicted SpoU family rRNA methylase
MILTVLWKNIEKFGGFYFLNIQHMVLKEQHKWNLNKKLIFHKYGKCIDNISVILLKNKKHLLLLKLSMKIWKEKMICKILHIWDSKNILFNFAY